MNKSPEQIQELYYTETATTYDDWHTTDEADEHYSALKFIDMLCGRLDIKSLLDVGAGTGRGVRFFQERGRNVVGVEPVRALIEQAERNHLLKGTIVEGSGYSLPFADNSVDAVFECGVLHHVAEPSRVVDEMTRVAKTAVFLSDSNVIGQGNRKLRWLKLALRRSELWRAARFIQTRGKMYTISQGDGLGYSYTVYDSYRQLAAWADTILPIATAGDPASDSWLHPMLTSRNVLLCAIKGRL